MKSKLQIVNERSVSQMVLESLRRAIIRGDLKLGERLVEANIAKELDVSITPVRHAFTQLANEGLIKVHPFKSTNVVEITESFIEELYSIRIMLELKAVELAFPRLTEEDCLKMESYAHEMDQLMEKGAFEEVARLDTLFHGYFYEYSNHQILLELWEKLKSRIQLLQSYGQIYSQPIIKGRVETRHNKIVNAIRSHDLQLLLQAVKEHIETGKQMLINPRNQ